MDMVKDAVTPVLTADRTLAIVQQPANITLTDIQPQAGQIYHISGPGAAGGRMRPVVEQWVVQAIEHEQTVHWIDGACRMNPARFIPLLEQHGLPINESLSRIFLSRGFTLHQLDSQLARLPSELAITKSPIVVVDGLVAMHEDDAIGSLESRILLRRHIHLLESIAHQRQVAVILITEASSASKRHERRLKYLRRHAHNHLHGRLIRRKRTSVLHLYHPRSGQSGTLAMPIKNEQTRFRIPTPVVRIDAKVVYPQLEHPIAGSQADLLGDRTVESWTLSNQKEQEPPK